MTSAETTNETILVIKNEADDATALVMEWANCREVEIDEAGNIWIANPQTGHWLDEDKKAEFVAWCMAQ